MMKTAIIYARVSDEEQVEGVSLDAQIDRCRERAAKIGATVIAEYVDAGKSAFKGVRAEFDAAVSHAAKARVTYFICWDSSRFARSRLVAQLAKSQLEKAGVEWIYVAWDIDVSEPIGRLCDGVLELFDELASVQNSSSTTRSMKKLIREGIWCNGPAPFGYRKPSAREKLQIVAHEAHQIELIFDSRLSGFGATLIADKLNGMGLKRRGKRWTKTSVLTQLRAEIVTGRLSWKHTATTKEPLVVEQFCPAIIQRQAFEAVQELLIESAPSSDSSSAKSAHVFSGLLRCIHCGTLMQIVSGGGRNGRHTYYKCGQHIRHKLCSPLAIPASRIEPVVLNHIIQHVLRPQTMRTLEKSLKAAARTYNQASDGQVKALREELQAVKSKLAAVYDAIEQGKITAFDIGDRIRERKADIQRLELAIKHHAQVAPETFPNTASIVLPKLIEEIKNPDNSKSTRAWLKTIVRDMRVENNTVHIDYLPAALIDSLQLVHSKAKWLPDPSLLGTAKLLIPLAA